MQDFDDPRLRFAFAAPDPDPFATPNRRHENAATGRHLTPTNFMPFGEHLGKRMDRIPLRYLAWCSLQPWFQMDNPDWWPVVEFIDLHVRAQRAVEWAVALDIETKLLAYRTAGDWQI